MNLVFDLDDTLYDLSEPFRRSHKDLFAEQLGEDCEELFRMSRIYSDEVLALEKEGKAILANVKKGAGIVALCVEGKSLSSEELADFVARRALEGAGDLAFVIGSSHGLAPAVKQAAALRFSMGRITLPHQLARLVLCEQIYRAFTINAGVKYHK